MSDEKIIFLRSLIKCFELAAALTGLLLWQKWKGSIVKYLVIYLVIITLSEFCGNILTEYNYIVAKGNLYKLFVLPFEFLFFCFFFYKEATNSYSKKLIIVFVVAFIICWVIEQLFWDNVKLPFSSFSYSVGNLFLLIIIFRFFILLTRSSELLGFVSNPFFWIAVGALIFYLGSFPYYLIFNTLAKNYYLDIYLPYHVIVIFLNYIMYTIFIFAFIWTKPK